MSSPFFRFPCQGFGDQQAAVPGRRRLGPLSALKVYTTTYSSRNSSYEEHTELTEMYNNANDNYLLDPEKRCEIAMEMEKYIIEHAVVVPVTYSTNYILIADRIVLAVDQWDSDLGWMYCNIAQ